MADPKHRRAPTTAALFRAARTARSVGSALIRSVATGAPAPLSVTLAFSNRCNVACSYCGIPKLRRQQEHPCEWWLSLLDDLRAAGTCRVQLTGGEPLMFEGIERVAARAHELDMIVSLGTNGILLPERRAILEHLDYVVVSVDGPAEVSDAQRFPGSHEAAIRAIRVAQDAGVTVWTTAVITTDSIDRIPELVAWAETLDVRVNLQLPFHPEDYCGIDNGHVFPSSEQIARMLTTVRPHSGVRGRILNTHAYWNHVERWAHLGAAISTEADATTHQCAGGSLFHHVEPNGWIFPCAHLVGRGQGGSIPELGLAGALEAAAIRSCETCLSGYAHEQSLLYSLNPSAALSWGSEITSFLLRPGGPPRAPASK